MRRLLLPCALALAAGLLGLPAAAGAQPAAADLPALRASLAASADRATRLAEELEQAAARDGGLHEALEQLALESDTAQARLDDRVRQAYMRGGPDPLARLVVGVGSPVVPRAARQGLSAAVQAERDLVDAVSEQSSRVRVLQARAAAFRSRLRTRALAVLVEQERARALLASATAVVARQAAAATRAADAAQQARLAAEQQQLAQAEGVLDAVSASVTRSLTPAQTARSRRSQLREAPLTALAEAAGAGYPAGYAPTGRTVSGQASWYGPGFVGSPTASGTPYDPERLTCAHKTLPLGTLVRVTRADRAITCLVNDRGPYVGDRVLDLSRAGSRALGYEGVADVVAEVLAPA